MVSHSEKISQRNIGGYRWFQFASSMMGWLPVFFLYFNQYVDLPDVIQLGALYYFSVCVFEVPSGYFSDRYGRRRTLLLAGISLSAAYLFFLTATSFAGLALGQISLALGIALMSGTDTAFLYDSLIDIGEQSRYADEEARGQKFGMIAITIGSLLGGVTGLIDLRLPYLFSFCGAVWATWLAFRFIEPGEHKPGQQSDTDEFRGSFIEILRECGKQLKQPVLAWLFGVMVLMYGLEHVSFEFYQPYIKLLAIPGFEGDSAPLVSGLVISVSMFGGTLGAAYSVRLSNWLGLKALLFIAFAIQLIIIGGLSLVLHTAMLALVFFRNFPMAMIHAPVNAAIAPRIGSHLRATYLSVQSLSARLVFSTLLFFLSQAISDGETSWPSLSLVLKIALVYGLAGMFLAFMLMPRKSLRQDHQPDHQS